MELNYINYNRPYHETGTDAVYFFDRGRYKEATDEYCKKKKYYEKKYKYVNFCNEFCNAENNEIYFGNVSQMQKYTSKKDPRQPVDIQECKALGKFVCGNEYVFLRKYTFQNNIHRMFCDVFSLYDTSNCFNKIPENEKGVEETYYSERLDMIQKEIDCTVFDNPETKNKLTQIVKDSRIFVKSYSVPGVVDSWLELNPKLKYFDPVFDIIQLNKELYQKIQNKEYDKIHFRFYPTTEELKARNKYFENIKEENEKYNFNFSDERYFQDELINTINLLFKNL